MATSCDTKRNARNREVVHVDHRLHSPAYDWDGDDGLAQSTFEFFDADAMCFFGICGPWSYNGWVKSTNNYIHNVLEKQYEKVIKKIKGHYQGAPVPMDLQEELNNVEALIQSWDNANYRPNKDQLDKFAHPTSMWWSGQIRAIIDYFDAAACKVDVLDAIAVELLNSPAIAIGDPRRVLKKSPTSSGVYLDGSGGPSQGGSSNTSFAASAIGIMALGAAGYFGFKVLTE
jgi:hypothetical protein